MSAGTRIRRQVPRLALQRTEAAESLGMSVEHFDRHVKPYLPVVYSGSLRLYPVAGLQKWVDDQATTPGRAA